MLLSCFREKMPAAGSHKCQWRNSNLAFPVKKVVTCISEVNTTLIKYSSAGGNDRSFSDSQEV